MTSAQMRKVQTPSAIKNLKLNLRGLRIKTGPKPYETLGQIMYIFLLRISSVFIVSNLRYSAISHGTIVRASHSWAESLFLLNDCLQISRNFFRRKFYSKNATQSDVVISKNVTSEWRRRPHFSFETVNLKTSNDCWLILSEWPIIVKLFGRVS